jgi:cytochrome c-type biogenesis protein CcmH
MTLWFACALITALVAATVFLPLVRRRGEAAARVSYDRAVYRDQLAEIERDRARGVLSEVESAAARTEIERRLLSTAAASEAMPARVSLPERGVLAAVLAILVPLGALAIYLLEGAPTLPDQPYAGRAAERELAEMEGGSVDLAKAEQALQAKVRDEPENGDAWFLLARTEAALGHWQQSAAAYQKALTLTRQRPDVAAAYGEMLVLAGDGMVSPAAHDAFAAALAHDPKNASARFYLGLALAQGGNAQGAIDAWQQLLADAPADAPYAPLVRQRLVETARAAGLPVPAASASPVGPSADDMAAAASMTPEQRAQMIQGMVDRLADRLKENPNDLQGWLRLGRAYTVLDQNDKAADAFAHAATIDPDDPEILSQEVNALMAHHKPSEAIPEGTRALLKKLEALDANDPRALWYLGLAAAQDRHLDEAKTYWRRLVEVLPAESDDRKMVAAALAALEAK